MNFKNKLIAQLAHLEKDGLLRSRLLGDAFINKVNFSSNDYLSLKDFPPIKQFFSEGFARFPTGSGASMTVCGYHSVHQALERAFANYYEADAALLFSSGYAANLGIVHLLKKLHCHLYIDKSIHASIYDGINHINVPYTRFIANSIEDLTKKLDHNQDLKIILTEGLFSMSGQVPNLQKINQLCDNNQTTSIIDEAHSFGILGPSGLGTAALYNLTQKEIPLRMIAFGKAMGCQGAVVVGQKEWIDGLYQFARSYIYSTAISPALAWGLLNTLDFVVLADDRRKKLFDLVAYFQQQINLSPLSWTLSTTPIQQLKLGCPHKALYFADELKKVGVLCQAMRAPTVSTHATGLRVVLNYHHEQDDIDFLFQHIHRIYDSFY